MELEPFEIEYIRLQLQEVAIEAIKVEYFQDPEPEEVEVDRSNWKNPDTVKRSFETYFDGVYDIEPRPGVPGTYSMGICKLEFDCESDTLTVHLRRPGLLIGKAGRTINDLKEYLECKVEIIEVRKL
jgi:hypothetical protein